MFYFGHLTFCLGLKGNEAFIRDRLQPSQSSHMSKTCLPGTRKDVLRQIYSWAKDTSQPNILWINGSPGSGKSAIAGSSASGLRDRKHKVLIHHFKRGDPVLSDPAVLWRTIAFGLSCHDAILQKDIYDTLKGPHKDLDLADIRVHFKALVEELLRRHFDLFSSKFPLVVIVDALDECDVHSHAQRRSLMHTLKLWSHLPKKFKLVVTSRDVSDVRKSLASSSHQIGLLTGDLVDSQTSKDIEFFLKEEFKYIAEDYHTLKRSWPEATKIKQLAQKAAGLFIWAETIIKFIGQGDPEKQLALVSKGTTLDLVSPIDELYYTILESHFENDAACSSLKIVAGAICLAQAPFSRESLGKILQGHESSTSIDFVLQRLQSVLFTHNNTLRVSHQSFSEFLLHEERSKEFAIDKGQQNYIMVLQCLKIMHKKLKFNICRLKSSHIPNIQVEGLSKQIKKEITPDLVYACQFWWIHFQQLEEPTDKTVTKAIKEFLNVHLLHWLEVLSLIKEVPIAVRALITVADQYKVIYQCVVLCFY